MPKSSSSKDVLQDGSTPESPSFSRTDIVKKGCLHVKESMSFSFIKFKFKSWQARLLVLRDTWTDEGVAGDTTLEIHPMEPNVENELSPNLINPSKAPVKLSFSNPTSTDLSSFKLFKDALNDRFVNLKSVRYVEVYKTSHTFPHAFIVHIEDKPPLIFGAKSDLEMREWMMAIKLLADKACKNSQPRFDASNFQSKSPFPDAKYDFKRSKEEMSAANFRCFVVDILSSEIKASPKLTSKLNGQFLFCVSPTGVMKIVSRYNSIGGRSKSCSDEVCDKSDAEDSGSSDKSGGTRRELCRWRVEDVRKLKSENVPGKRENLITLETCSRCKDFPGTFKFHTKQGLELIQYVRKIALQFEGRQSMSRSTDELQSRRDSPAENTRADISPCPLEIPPRAKTIPKPPPRPLFTISDP